MTIVDWRQVDARALAPVFARERTRWLVQLGWDTGESWAQVERARTSWGLPGLAAVDDSGHVRGLTFFHETGGRFDIGGLLAQSDAVREALLDAAVSVCADAGAEELAAFVYEANLPFAKLFAAKDFSQDRMDYLSLSLDHSGLTEPASGDGPTRRDWQASDAESVAALLHESYEAAAARRFVPDATELDWRHYVSTMVQHQACGRLLPAVTRVAQCGDALIGAVLVTDLGPGTAHIAQLAVHPEWRRQGLAGELIDDAAGRARAAGYGRMTLLASAANAAAQALYRDRGYVTCGTFLAATKRLTARPSVRTCESLAS